MEGNHTISLVRARVLKTEFSSIPEKIAVYQTPFTLLLSTETLGYRVNDFQRAVKEHEILWLPDRPQRGKVTRPAF